jgi:hypothetical protein
MPVADLLAFSFVLIFLLLYFVGIGFIIYRIVNQPIFSKSERIRYILLLLAIPVFGAFMYVIGLEPGLKQNATKKPPLG